MPTTQIQRAFGYYSALVCCWVTFLIITARAAMSPSETQQAEMLSELYYTNQKIERNDAKFPVIPSVVHKFRPNYPCLAGTIPLGSGDTVGSTIRDGHQYACGLHAITGTPSVYSFGCYRKQDYEKSLLQHRPDAVVSIFELLPDMLVPDYQRGDQILRFTSFYSLIHTVWIQMTPPFALSFR